MLAHLLPDVLHGLTVRAPGCVEFYEYGEPWLGGHRVEVVSYKYRDRSKTTINWTQHRLLQSGNFTRSSNLLAVPACLNVVWVILIWKTQWTVLCWDRSGFHSLVEISLNQPQTSWAEMLEILFLWSTKTRNNYNKRNMWKNATLKKYYMLISSFSVVTSIGYSKKFHQSEIIVPVHVDADEPKFPPHTGSNVSNFLCNLNIISSEE